MPLMLPARALARYAIKSATSSFLTIGPWDMLSSTGRTVTSSQPVQILPVPALFTQYVKAAEGRQPPLHHSSRCCLVSHVANEVVETRQLPVQWRPKL